MQERMQQGAFVLERVLQFARFDLSGGDRGLDRFNDFQEPLEHGQLLDPILPERVRDRIPHVLAKDTVRLAAVHRIDPGLDTPQG